MKKTLTLTLLAACLLAACGPIDGFNFGGVDYSPTPSLSQEASATGELPTDLYSDDESIFRYCIASNGKYYLCRINTSVQTAVLELVRYADLSAQSEDRIDYNLPADITYPQLLAIFPDYIGTTEYITILVRYNNVSGNPEVRRYVFSADSCVVNANHLLGSGMPQTFTFQRFLGSDPDSLVVLASPDIVYQFTTSTTAMTLTRTVNVTDDPAFDELDYNSYLWGETYSEFLEILPAPESGYRLIAVYDTNEPALVTMNANFEVTDIRDAPLFKDTYAAMYDSDNAIIYLVRHLSSSRNILALTDDLELISVTDLGVQYTSYVSLAPADFGVKVFWEDGNTPPAITMRTYVRAALSL